jgi:hypothetical protein
VVSLVNESYGHPSQAKFFHIIANNVMLNRVYLAYCRKRYVLVLNVPIAIVPSAIHTYIAAWNITANLDIVFDCHANCLSFMIYG